MSRDTPEIAAARIEAERARARLMETARQLQERLSPGTLAQNAWEGAKIKGADLAEDAVDAVRQRPALASAVVAAVAMFIARRPLIDLAGKVADEVGSKVSPKRRRKARKADKQPDKQTETVE